MSPERIPAVSRRPWVRLGGRLEGRPFVNVRTRPRGIPARLGVRLPELNLRTYVTCNGEPGVSFLSLDANGFSAVLGARLLHHLPYYYARMRWRWDDRRRRMTFGSRRLHPGDRPARFEASYGSGEVFTPDPGSRAEFLTERRRPYTQGTGGGVRHTDVEHEPWTLHPATVSVAENTLFEANGFDRPVDEPVCYYSPGVDVVTTRSRRWDRTDDP